MSVKEFAACATRKSHAVAYARHISARPDSLDVGYSTNVSGCDTIRETPMHHFAVASSLFAEFAVSEITHGQVIKNVRLAWRQISHLRGWRERGQFAVFEHGVDRAVCLLDQR